MVASSASHPIPLPIPTRGSRLLLKYSGIARKTLFLSYPRYDVYRKKMGCPLFPIITLAIKNVSYNNGLDKPAPAPDPEASG
ncbi:MAG TPA: hypothetical protein PK874_07250 [Desulfobacteraceae bacterium]|nr:hypothetical protein [Desulfobacteraceae bacterium]